MNRRAHYLRTTKGGQFPRSILSAAVCQEAGGRLAWSTVHVTTENGAPSEPESTYGVGAASFWADLKIYLKSYPGTWVVFYGACEQLTLLGFWDLLEEDKWSLADANDSVPAGGGEGKNLEWRGTVILEDAPTIVVAKEARSRRTARFLDCRNFGVQAWASLYAAPMPQGDCQAEAKVKAAAIARFLTELLGVVTRYRLGSLKCTVASQAMHAYRHRFLKAPVLVHDNLPAIGLERAALYGGRNECWSLGLVAGGVTHLDFNQFYPYCVTGEKMPARLCGFEMGCKPHPDELMKRGYLVIAEVTLDTDEPIYPVRFSRTRHARWQLPYPGANPKGYPRDDDLVYPVGRFTTALCGPELSLAFGRGEVSRVHSTAWYEPSELFTQWACELAFLEEESKNGASKALQQCVKRLRNCLFGKFAQWSWRWQPAPEVEAGRPFKIWYEPKDGCDQLNRYRSIGWVTSIEERHDEGAESCPAIAAWVYSLARVRLWKALETAGRSNVHYMDTDSIWCNWTGSENLRRAGLIHCSMPGYLKTVGMHDSVRFYGLKQYELDGKSVHAGIPEHAEGNHHDGWRYQSPEKLGPALMKGRAPAVKMLTHKVKMDCVYRHGTVTTGGRVIPFTFNED